MDSALLLVLAATIGWGSGDVFVRKAMFGASPETVTILLISVVSVVGVVVNLLFHLLNRVLEQQVAAGKKPPPKTRPTSPSMAVSSKLAMREMGFVTTMKARATRFCCTPSSSRTAA